MRDLAKGKPEKNPKAGYGKPPHPAFEPGNPGGPGRPKGSVSLLTEIKRRLLEIDPKSKREILQHVTDAYLMRLRDGDPRILQDFLDRTDGKPRQGIDLGTDEGALTLVWPVSTTKSESPNGNGHNGNGNGNGPTNRIASADSGAGNGSH